jgi:hypothetical protein
MQPLVQEFRQDMQEFSASKNPKVQFESISE